MANHWLATVRCTGSAPCKPLQVLRGGDFHTIRGRARLPSSNYSVKTPPVMFGEDTGGQAAASWFPPGDGGLGSLSSSPLPLATRPTWSEASAPLGRSKRGRAAGAHPSPATTSPTRPRCQFSHSKLDTRFSPLIALRLFYVHRTCFKTNRRVVASLEAPDRFISAGFFFFFLNLTK